MSCDECANFKPKRKQTGWVCRVCECPCYVMVHSPVKTEVSPICAMPWLAPRKEKFVPFYGRVVE